jgi:hypothetical protein
MAPETMIGTITLFDPKQKVGVISLKSPNIYSQEGAAPGAPAIPGDLFFQMDDHDLNRLRLGQLVQFAALKEGEQWLVRDIQVLSMKA